MTTAAEIEARARALGEREAADLMDRVRAGQAGAQQICDGLSLRSAAAYGPGGQERMEGYVGGLLTTFVRLLRKERPQ